MTQATPDPVPYKTVRKVDSAARRTRLREFQIQLIERVQTARSGTDTRVNQLGVMIGQTRWLLDLKEASEIVSIGAITPVPLTQDWYLGLSNLRGNLISVVDFARFQGHSTTQIEQDSRIVAFAPALSFNCGLLVSRVMGLRNVADMELQPDQAAADTPWAPHSYRDRDSQVWRQLNLSLIVQDPRFLQVGL
ncbi:chemotaxis protein CheW [Undibacterium arcticum]|uniref:Chemotaxis protein CheW n=1 Tax=Undibacterium arcticum TaxID=1762892 RepID=A0ABV7FAA0_9BURK